MFVRVVVGVEGGRMVARSSGGQGSNVLSAAAAANGMAVVPRGVALVEKGDPVAVEMLRSPESRTEDETPDE